MSRKLGKRTTSTQFRPSSFERDIWAARHAARQQALEEQAERQRFRAPEPGPPEPVEWHGDELSRDYGERAVIAVVVFVLVIIWAIFGAWAFWISLFVSTFTVAPWIAYSRL